MIYLQSMDASRKSDRLQYRCTTCNKMGRRGRVVGHFFKYHVPFDRVPFSCSLCNFRCQTQQHLAEHVTQYAPHVREAKAKGVTDLRPFLNRSTNPYVLSERDVEKVGDGSVDSSFNDEDGDGWFEIQDEAPLFPDWMNPAALAVSRSPLRTTVQTHFAQDKSLVANACSPIVHSSWFQPQRRTPLQPPQYIPTPKAVCATQMQQPTQATQQLCSSGPRPTATAPAAATPGTPILDENVLQLDDDFADFLNEEPVASGLVKPSPLVAASTGQAYSSPSAKRARNVSPPSSPKKDVLTTRILENIQKTTSDIAASTERVARELSRHTRILEKQTDLLHRIATAVLQVRDDVHRSDRHKENRAPVKSTVKSVKK